MPNFDRKPDPGNEDLDIATQVLQTVQKQVASYHDALQTIRTMRKELASRQAARAADSGAPSQLTNTPELLAALFKEHGVPEPFANAMAAEDFQDPSYDKGAAFWTWDCCCSDCCLTCVMGSVVTDCVGGTFVW
ncbi:hypothetical protein QA860_25410 [Streptomyces stelliscabiei]|uniref:hypothetical protein n=1 Tax=Streptomyces stelliscabiei TaxID=146820 RepID=UPI002FF2009A